MITRLYVKTANAVAAARANAAARRGAGFLEYALLALIAIVILSIMREQFKTFITSLWRRIKEAS